MKTDVYEDYSVDIIIKENAVYACKECNRAF